MGKKITQEELLSKELLNIVKIINPLININEYSHMAPVFEMLVGGLILPVIADGNPNAVSEKDKEMLKDYTKDKIEALLNPAVIITPSVRSTTSSKSTVSTKSLKNSTSKVLLDPDGNPITKDGDKFRRIKTKINKKSRFERALTPKDRDIITTHWNQAQKLVPDNDPVCTKIADEINAKRTLEPLAPSQIAGYFSHLARVCERGQSYISDYNTRAIKRNFFNVPIIASDAFIDEIHENTLNNKKDETARAIAHAKILEIRSKYDKIVADQMSTASTVQPDPVPTNNPATVQDINVTLPEEIEITF